MKLCNYDCETCDLSHIPVNVYLVTVNMGTTTKHSVCFKHAVRCAQAGFDVINYTISHNTETSMPVCVLCTGAIKLQGVI